MFGAVACTPTTHSILSTNCDINTPLICDSTVRRFHTLHFDSQKKLGQHLYTGVIHFFCVKIASWMLCLCCFSIFDVVVGSSGDTSVSKVPPGCCAFVAFRFSTLSLAPQENTHNQRTSTFVDTYFTSRYNFVAIGRPKRRRMRR
jgi:hypothetical protein